MGPSTGRKRHEVKYPGRLKKGYTPCWKKGTPVNSDNSDNSDNCDIVVSETVTETATTKILRPSKRVYNAALAVQSTSTPMLLRPRAEKRRKEDEMHSNSNIIDINNDENFLVHSSCILALTQVFNKHGKGCQKLQSSVKVVERHGLCVTVEASCLNCAFTLNVDLFKSSKKLDNVAKSRGDLNNRLALPVLKTKIGVSDCAFMLACLNVRPPYSFLMYQHVNRACDRMVNINEESMTANQQFVNDVLHTRGDHDGVNVLTDTSYNNRIQAGYEAGTIAITPMVECSTPENLVLALNVSNKLCRRKNCRHDACHRTYPAEASIASTETKNTVRNLESIHNKGILKVKSVTSDACRQIEKAVRDYSNSTKNKIKHYYCVIHRMRTFQKRIKSLKIITCVPSMSNEVFSQKLSSAVRSRTYLELKRARSHCKHNHDFRVRAHEAVANILPCFSGSHVNCMNISFVCSAHLHTFSMSHLPNSTYLRLSAGEQQKLQHEITKYFSVESLEKIENMLNTNKVENNHHRVFTYAPKNTTWSRNMTAMCQSAVHSDSMNTGQSCLILAESLGIEFATGSAFQSYMKSIDNKHLYDHRRQLSSAYKFGRYNSRRRKMNRRLLNDSLYANCDNATATDHAYGVNVNS